MTLQIETELLNIPIEKPSVFAWRLDDGEALLMRLVHLAERQFDATGPGFLSMRIHTERHRHLKYSVVLVRGHVREKIVKDFRKEFDLLEAFCRGFFYGAIQGPGWDALQPHLRMTWQTKANWDAVQAAEKKAA